jgi:hypothetical protein
LAEGINLASLAEDNEDNKEEAPGYCPLLPPFFVSVQFLLCSFPFLISLFPFSLIRTFELPIVLTCSLSLLIQPCEVTGNGQWPLLSGLARPER